MTQIKPENPDADDEFWDAHADYMAAVAAHEAGTDKWEERTAAFYRMLAAHAKGGGYQCPVVRSKTASMQ
jgi:hypothetical protein